MSMRGLVLFSYLNEIELISIIRNQVEVVCWVNKWILFKNVNTDCGRGHAKENIKRRAIFFFFFSSLFEMQLKWWPAAIESTVYLVSFSLATLCLFFLHGKWWLKIAIKSSLATYGLLFVQFQNELSIQWRKCILFRLCVFGLSLNEIEGYFI